MGCFVLVLSPAAPNSYSRHVYFCCCLISSWSWNAKQDLKASSCSSIPQTHKHVQCSYWKKKNHNASSAVKESLSARVNNKRSVNRRVKGYFSKLSYRFVKQFQEMILKISYYVWWAFEKTFPSFSFFRNARWVIIGFIFLKLLL